MTVLAPTLMIQGTASSVGKSLLVAAFGRIFARKGLAVAPFKAQNMALNAHVTADGLEIGRAQALQARACGVSPDVRMNPILLKPETDRRVQVVVLGKALSTQDAAGYHDDKLSLRTVVIDALSDLRRRFDLVLIEGAGSPAEINLRARDLVNMFVAHAADAPVLLVGDIDRGGVFAHLMGTLMLLDQADQARIRGFIINKFRGDVDLLRPGLNDLERRTGYPVMGVVPYVPSLRLGDEDSLSLDERGPGRSPLAHELDIVVVRLPHVANTDDFDALAAEPETNVRFVDDPAAVLAADLAIVPGTKSTVTDLAWLRSRGLDHALRRRAERNQPILGVCGGCQMLGSTLADPHGVESEPGTVVPGLGLLPLTTVFAPGKNTRRITVRSTGKTPFLPPFDSVTGYWIHAGRTSTTGAVALEVRDGDVWHPDGAVAGDCVAGTMVHGLFEHPIPRGGLLAHLAALRGLIRPTDLPPIATIDAELDRLADVVQSHVDMEALTDLVRLP